MGTVPVAREPDIGSWWRGGRGPEVVGGLEESLVIPVDPVGSGRGTLEPSSVPVRGVPVEPEGSSGGVTVSLVSLSDSESPVAMVTCEITYLELQEE